MKLRILFLLLLLPLLNSYAGPSTGIQVNGIYYSLNQSSKEATVVNADYTGDVVIPESFDYDGSTYYVTAIESSYSPVSGRGTIGGFENCSELRSVSIPKSIKTIGYLAFYGCASLKAVYITDLSAWCNIKFGTSDGLGKESNPLFYAHDLYLRGDKITNLTIPDDVTSIDNSFIGCSLSSVTFHKDFKKISDMAFIHCESLTDVYSLSPNITISTSHLSVYCGFTEFENKTLHIRERYVNNYIPEDPMNPFNPTYWFNFGAIEYIDGVDYNLIYMVDGEEYKRNWMEIGETIVPEPAPTKGGYTFSGWSEIPETMPNHDLTILGSFSPNTYKLTYIVDGEEYKVVEMKCDETITAEPEPIKKGMTFSGWSDIPEKMPANDVTVIGTFGWSKISNNKIIYQVTDTINNCAAVIGNEDMSGGVTIASDVEFDYNYKVTSIANNAFNGCKEITTIDMPATITSIGERAFAKIDKLTDVTIFADEVPTTDRTAFENSYIDYVTLHVPAGSVEKYKKTGPWKGFKEIVPIEGANPTTVSPIYSVESQKACYNLNGINITNSHKTAKGVIIRGGNKYYIK